MGNRYVESFEAVAVTAEVDLFEIVPADDRPVKVVGFSLAQTTDMGDSEAEQVRIEMIRGLATSGSGGATPNSATVGSNQAAKGYTAERTNTTVAVVGGGSTEVVYMGGWNVQIDKDFFFPSGWEPECNQGDNRIVLRMSAPADSVTVSGSLFVEEL